MVSHADYSTLAEALFPALYRVCVSILRHPQDAQDAAQEALLKGWAQRHRIKEKTAKAYLMRIAVNECRNIQRLRMKETPQDNLQDIGLPQAESDLDLRQAVDRLPETLRLPILLYYMEGWTDKMVAKALQTTALAVRTRLSRARKQLKEALRQMETEGETR